METNEKNKYLMAQNLFCIFGASLLFSLTLHTYNHICNCSNVFTDVLKIMVNTLDIISEYSIDFLVFLLYYLI